LLGGARMKAAVALSIVSLAACGGDPDLGPVPVTTGAYHHYVTSSLRIPTSAELQREYGLDVDGDPDGRPDNQLGNVFVALTSNSDADLQGEIDAALAGGQLVLLHSVRADDLTADRSVSWQVYTGTETAVPPAFDGSDSFEMGEGTSQPIIGYTSGGAYDATIRGAGALTVKLAVSPSAPPIALDLIQARVEATIDADGCSGRFGGAVTQEQVDTRLIPSVVAMMNGAIARDPGCPLACEMGTSAALIIEVFDDNMDGTITEEELRQSSIIQTLLAPDLDLLDASGAFEPDGLEESISLGVGFDCVTASLPAP
jgi:hypothetical protein